MGFPIGEKLTKIFEYDFDVDGGAVGTIAMRSVGADLHAGCHITRMYIIASDLSTSAGTPTVIIGNTTDDNGYFEDIYALLAADKSISSGEVAGALLFDDTNDHEIMYSPAVANDLDMNMIIGTAALTAGKFKLFVEFIRA